jgi:hypothetical protein
MFPVIISHDQHPKWPWSFVTVFSVASKAKCGPFCFPLQTLM